MTTDKNMLMAYLYDELKDEEKVLFEKQLASSPELQLELKELQEMRSIMSEWKDEIPETLIMPDHKGRKIFRFSTYSFTAGIAASFFILALLSLMAGAKFSYSGKDGFSLTLGNLGNRYVDQQVLKTALDSITKVKVSAAKTNVQLVSQFKPDKNELSEKEMQQVMKLMNEQNGKNLNTLVNVLQKNQEKQLDLTLHVFAKYLEQQRKSDIQTIGSEMDKIKRTSDDKFYETDLALNKLFQTVQYTNR